MMENKDFLGAKKYVLSELKKLPKSLCYHNLDHTKDVLRAVERLSKMEKIPEKKRVILKTAALFHDIGLSKKYNGHEVESIKIARKVLPNFNYTKKEIEIISGAIRSTQLPQKPKTKFDKILCDADLDNFGRKDFFMQTEKVRRELWSQGIKIGKKKWFENTLKLMENHRYFTASARKLRDKRKEKNMKKLKSLF